MKRSIPYFFITLSFFLSGCKCSKCQSDPDVISTRYLHRYGYDVSPQEWKEANYPGKVITTLRDGVIVTASYEDHKLHGEMTRTYPHSQTIATRSVYQKGSLVKKTYYDIRGIPQKEETFLAPSHMQTMHWYQNGSPMHLEEYRNSSLIEAKYYNPQNETECKVVSGEGTRLVRDEHGRIVMRETISHGKPILQETFYPHGVPHIVKSLSQGFIHGEMKVYEKTGELISIENYHQDTLHGKAIYYQKGNRYLEVGYQNGFKHGIEKHFVDGKTLVEETQWFEGKKHGPSIVYFDGMSKTQWYYNDEPVSKEKYRQLSALEENIAIMQERVFRSQLENIAETAVR
jgi:antitoxin component YwqK of YwqJK toxin-antitoxin module